MTDFELNKAIAEAVYPTNDWFLYEHAPNGSSVENGNGCILNFAESWESLMPLVVEYNITTSIRVVADGDNEFSAFTDQHSATGESPQRALALCLLKVLEAKVDE